MRSGSLILTALTTLMLAGCSSLERLPLRDDKGGTGEITGVSDGDTLRVSIGGVIERVRLIGLDTPETVKPGTPVECGGREAKSAMLRLAFSAPRDSDGDGLLDRAGGSGVRVRIALDRSQAARDRYGRLLGYVTRRADKRDLAEAQLRAGLAELYVFRGRPFARIGRYTRAEASARTARRGSWAACDGDFHR